MYPDFRFPFQPYEIQQSFAEALFDCLEGGKVGIFESPTGTGKSLSIICGSMAWLAHHRDTAPVKVDISAAGKEVGEGSDDEPDWVTEQSEETSANAARVAREKEKEIMEERRRRAEAHDLEIRRQAQTGFKKAKVVRYPNAPKEDIEDADLILEDGGGRTPGVPMSLTRSVAFLAGADLDLVDPFAPGEDDVLDSLSENRLKIFYCSRTHSQLSQFTQELKKTAWSQDAVSIPLGSRKNMCINETLIAKNGTGERLNEACIELQSAGKNKQCSHMITEDVKSLDMKDYTLGGVHDIEELVTAGKSLHVCPYYASRQSVSQAQIVTLPYNMILQKSAREVMGVSLKGQIVIIDEAHNLVETISSIHSTSISLEQLIQVQLGLQGYLTQFQRRLSPTNAMHIRTLKVLLDGFIKSVEAWRKAPAPSTNEALGDASKILHTNAFLNECGVEGINLMEMCTFLHESKLARKLHSYVERGKAASGEPNKENPPRSFGEHGNSSTTSDVHLLQKFIFCLADVDYDGRIILGKEGGKEDPGVTVKYILLNPAERFREVVEDSRSVILAGGTMGPVDLLMEHLFPHLDKEKLQHFSCGHVVPASSILTMSLPVGPSAKELKFTFGRRDNVEMIDDLGSAIANMCNLIPAGIVCFFPSFSYMEKVQARWREREILGRMERKKKVLFEQRSDSITTILEAYSAAIKNRLNSQTGAILFSVVGGRLSEGINFSDDMARGVILVGLPFPDLHSVELREKLSFVDSAGTDSSFLVPGDSLEMGPKASAYYESLCMRAVNQSIGRAIRHKGDYACILLADSRFSQRKFEQQLPSWLGNEIIHPDRFGSVIASVSKFFRSKISPHLM